MIAPALDYRGPIVGQYGHGIEVAEEDVVQMLSRRYRIYVYQRNQTRSIELAIQATKNRPCYVPLYPCILKDRNVKPEAGDMNEIVFLFKILRLLERTQAGISTDPADADLFIVPELFGTLHRTVGYKGWHIPLLRDMSWLPYYNSNTHRRHVFLRSIDCSNLGAKRQEGCNFDTKPSFVLNGSIFLSLGPKFPELDSHRGHIVIPFPINEWILQPAHWRDHPLRARPKLLFLYASVMYNRPFTCPVRRLRGHVLSTLEMVALHDTSLDVHIMQARNPTMPAFEAAHRYRNATFCPCLGGDFPATKRFFLAILTGCIPVVPLWNGGSWFRHNGPIVSESYPFPLQVSYSDMALQIPVEDWFTKDLVAILRQVPERVIIAKRRAMAKERNKFQFDYAGTRPDLFSSIMKEIYRLIEDDSRGRLTATENSVMKNPKCM